MASASDDDGVAIAQIHLDKLVQLQPHSSTLTWWPSPGTGDKGGVNSVVYGPIEPKLREYSFQED